MPADSDVHSSSGWSYALMNIIFKYLSHILGHAARRERVDWNFKVFDSNQSRWRDDGVDVLYTGSLADGLYMGTTTPSETDLSDIDTLVVVGEVTDSSQYRMTPTPGYPGYVHVMRVNDNTNITTQHFMESARQHRSIKYMMDKAGLTYIQRTGPALMCQRTSYTEDRYDEGGVCSPAAQQRERDWDLVPALRCDLSDQHTPDVLTAFINRARTSDWVSQALDNVPDMFSRYYLVAKPHPHDSTDETFRLSFSHIEIALARSLSDAQRTVYSVFKRLTKTALPPSSSDKTLVRRIVSVFKRCTKTALPPSLSDKTLVRTYYMKTAMYWTCDSYLKCDFTYSNIGVRVMELFEWLISCYQSGNLPNYIVSEENMICALSDDECQLVVSELRNVRDKWFTYWTRPECVPADNRRLLTADMLDRLSNDKRNSDPRLILPLLEECSSMCGVIRSGFMLHYDIIKLYLSTLLSADHPLAAALVMDITDMNDHPLCDVTDYIRLHHFTTSTSNMLHQDAVAGDSEQSVAGLCKYLNSNITSIISCCGDLGFPNYLYLYCSLCHLLPVDSDTLDWARWYKSQILFSKACEDGVRRDEYVRICQEYYHDVCSSPVTSSLPAGVTTDDGNVGLVHRYFDYARLSIFTGDYSRGREILSQLLSIHIDATYLTYPSADSLWIWFYRSELPSHDKYIQNMLPALDSVDNVTIITRQSGRTERLVYQSGVMLCEFTPSLYFYLIKLLHECEDTTWPAEMMLGEFEGYCVSSRPAGPQYTIFNTPHKQIDWTWYLLAYSYLRLGRVDAAKGAISRGFHGVKDDEICEANQRLIEENISN